MPGIAVTEAITTIAEAEQRFHLRRSQTEDFFREWTENLPELSSIDRTNLDILWQRYIYHRSAGNLLESTVMLLIVSPLLAIAGLYDPPFRVKSEESIRIELSDSEETLFGRIDVLVLRDRLWVIVLESKKTMFSVWSALPQTLAYLIASPNLDRPTFGILTNGDDFLFIKLESKEYAMSQVFSPLVKQQDLEQVCKILRKLSQIVLEP